ncbi:hypothetical protein FBU30_005225 [Linnemannia zychae]|nr:hypothetical protein FBU30_005225 [Linnemannia zychae]
MSNYSSPSMNSISTLSAASNVTPISSPTLSNNSIYATSPRSPLRKTIAGGSNQHPLATMSTFESESSAVNETNTDILIPAFRQLVSTQETTDKHSVIGESSTKLISITQGTLNEVIPISEEIHSDSLKELILSKGQQQAESSILDRKEESMKVLKSADFSGTHNVLTLQLKPSSQDRDFELTTAIELSNNKDTSESDWASVAVTSGDEQPLSPLTASYPLSVHYPTTPANTVIIAETRTGETITTEQNLQLINSAAESAAAPTHGIATQATHSSPEETVNTITITTTPLPIFAAPPSPRRNCEKWAPPPPKPRRTAQETHRAKPQPLSRLHFPRLLKQRSFNFPFSTSSSNANSGNASPESASNPTGRSTANTQGNRLALYNRQGPTAARTASCDIPRSVGPPDPIPSHYQHLQNRHNRRASSFRRRSHAGELERYSPGWVIVENSSQSGHTGTMTSTRVPTSDDQALPAYSEAHQRRSPANTSRRHASLGVQPHLTSMWGRLLTSILPSGNDHPSQESNDGATNRERDISAPLSMNRDIDPYLQQQMLLLTPLSQQQQIHPLYQQQLFFYADEVVCEPIRYSESDQAICQSEGIATEDFTNGQRTDSPSLFPTLAHNAQLQGELAQEDNRESLDMTTSELGVFMQSEQSNSGNLPVMVRGETVLTPKSLSADGKIPVSSLALSQPPSYWEAEIKYKGFPKIEPRPEQGQEILPRYTCSVFREGCVNRKTELVGNWRPYRRPWKRTFAHLRGTALRLYAVDMDDVPRLHVRNISLQLAKCEIATDYKQRSNVIRIRACDRTVLIECKDRIDALTWLEHLQAAANIATSLEDRCMPKFYTLPRAPPHSQQFQQQGNRSVISSNTRSSIGSNISVRQQTPQPLPPPQQPVAVSPVQQRRTSLIPMIASPRSSTEIDAAADPECRVRRARSGGLLTRSERNTTSGRDRRNNIDALNDEAVLQNVLRALGHTPDPSSPSTDDNDDSDNDEDDGQGTDFEVSPSHGTIAAATAAPVATREESRRRGSARRCSGACQRRHHSRHRRGHHHHDHNTPIAVACATNGVGVSDDNRVETSTSHRRGSEDHPSSDQATLTRGASHPVITVSMQQSSHQQQQRRNHSWNRRLFGGLWGTSHHEVQHESSLTLQQPQHPQLANSNDGALPLASAT